MAVVQETPRSCVNLSM